MRQIKWLALAVITMGGFAGGYQAMATDAPKTPAQSKALSKADLTPDSPDPNLWLADIHGEKALAWAKAQTDKTDAIIKNDPEYAADKATILSTLNANDRIPLGELKGNYVLNFWQDKDHVRGIWRRATIADYANKDPKWQTLLDVDKLDRDTGKNWVWQGADCTEKFERCLVVLSPGGGDAHVIREFNPQTGKFLDGGFELPEAKSNATYLDDDTVLFSTDFGKGTLTTSSYPRIVKMWKRGQKISDAKTVYEGKADDVWTQPIVFHGPYGTVPLVVRGLTFFTAEYYYVYPDGSTQKLPLPEGANIDGVTNGQLIFTNRNAFTPQGANTPIPQGSLIAFNVTGFAKQKMLPQFSVLYTPNAHSTIETVGAGRDAVYASVFENVTGSIHEFKLTGGKWTDAVLDLPKGGSTSVVSVNDTGPEAQFTFESFLTPPTLYAYDGKSAPKPIKAQQALFEAAKYSSEQHWATSKDGTKVPYFVIKQKGAKGPLPTILYSYGGFELSLEPWYWNDGHRPLDAVQAWVSKGGAIVVANIRGGGEFGPAWHQAALKYHRQRAYDDFEAVAEQIQKDGLTTPKQTGIVGASNGGLLVTTAMTERPDLFAAVVCQRPLIDMLRYTKYGAGASWIDEYGDPADPKMRKYILTYSPYQNVKKDVKYPPIFFITETNDDRVTPIWARMMAAKMEHQGHEVMFHETREGGHGPGATHAEEADYWAMSYTFFKRRLGLKD